MNTNVMNTNVMNTNVMNTNVMNTNVMNTNVMNTNWVNEFESTDKLYEDFYKESVETINIFCLYINSKNEIAHVSSEPHILQNETITKDTLFEIIRTKRTKEKTTYRLLSLLQYNFTKEPDAIIQQGINEQTEQTEQQNLLKSIHYLDDVTWERSVSCMRDLNCLYIIFYHDLYKKLKAHTTRKIVIQSNSNNRNRNRKTRHKRV